jgi:alkyl hydroperoxide reductase subunit AhpC
MSTHMHAGRLLCSAFAVLSLVACGGPTVHGSLTLGAMAPDFTATDDHGNTRKLSDFPGKFIVLEWHNHDCPYVAKHYNSHNMQQLQQAWTSRGVIWLVVESSAPGEQGYVTAAQSQMHMKQEGAAPTAVLLDPQGTLGHLYGAKVTPQMFVIDPKGILIYDGAIDDKRSTDVQDVAKSKNYISQALNQARAGQQVKEQTSTSYGCNIPYAHTGTK